MKLKNFIGAICSSFSLCINFYNLNEFCFYCYIKYYRYIFELIFVINERNNELLSAPCLTQIKYIYCRNNPYRNTFNIDLYLKSIIHCFSYTYLFIIYLH